MCCHVTYILRPGSANIIRNGSSRDEYLAHRILTGIRTLFFFFFFIDPPPTEISSLPLPAALPISGAPPRVALGSSDLVRRRRPGRRGPLRSNPLITVAQFIGALPRATAAASEP